MSTATAAFVFALVSPHPLDNFLAALARKIFRDDSRFGPAGCCCCHGRFFFFSPQKRLRDRLIVFRFEVLKAREGKRAIRRSAARVASFLDSSRLGNLPDFAFAKQRGHVRDSGPIQFFFGDEDHVRFSNHQSHEAVKIPRRGCSGKMGGCRST